jgi:holo-[acyl-carrier protein] synthase
MAVGIDLIEIERIERALERRPRLAARLFTDAELDYANARARPGRHLAARFAAKEAVAKAMELRGWAPREIEVLSEGGAPKAFLTGRVAARADGLGVGVEISLTHSRELASAVAVTSPR